MRDVEGQWITRICEDFPQQDNGYDCAVFMLSGMRHQVTTGKDDGFPAFGWQVRTATSRGKSLRRKIAREVLQGKLLLEDQTSAQMEIDRGVGHSAGHSIDRLQSWPHHCHANPAMPITWETQRCPFGAHAGKLQGLTPGLGNSGGMIDRCHLANIDHDDGSTAGSITPACIRQVVSVVPWEDGDVVAMDIGSSWGRVLGYLAAAGATKTIGLELSKRLVEAGTQWWKTPAVQNVLRTVDPTLGNTPALRHGDAKDMTVTDLPAGLNFVYMFDTAFGAAVQDQVRTRLACFPIHRVTCVSMRAQIWKCLCERVARQRTRVRVCSNQGIERVQQYIKNAKFDGVAARLHCAKTSLKMMGSGQSHPFWCVDLHATQPTSPPVASPCGAVAPCTRGCCATGARAPASAPPTYGTRRHSTGRGGTGEFIGGNVIHIGEASDMQRRNRRYDPFSGPGVTLGRRGGGAKSQAASKPTKAQLTRLAAYGFVEATTSEDSEDDNKDWEEAGPYTKP